MTYAVGVGEREEGGRREKGRRKKKREPLTCSNHYFVMSQLPFRDVTANWIVPLMLWGFFQLSNMLQTGFFHVAVVISLYYNRLFEWRKWQFYDVAMSVLVISLFFWWCCNCCVEYVTCLICGCCLLMIWLWLVENFLSSQDWTLHVTWRRCCGRVFHYQRMAKKFFINVFFNIANVDFFMLHALLCFDVVYVIFKCCKKI